MSHLAALAVLVIHFAFVAFVVLGGLVVWRWPRLARLHLPCVAWGMLVEFAGWICPLTPLEVALRHAAGDEAYAGDFIAHYLVALLYPQDLTREMQIGLGALLMVINIAIYVGLWRQQRRSRIARHISNDRITY